MAYLTNFSLLIRNKNFGLLYFGQFVSFVGTMITNVALPYQVYHLTHSTLIVGLLSLCQLIPLLFTALIGGVFADRYHRKKLLLFSELFLTLGCLILAINAASKTPQLTVIFITATCMFAITGLHRPALDSIIQQLVKKDDYATVGALATLKGSVCMIAGPAVAGLIIAYFGIVITFLVDAASFAVSLIALLLMTHVPKPKNHLKDMSTWASLKEGIRYAISRQELLGSYAVDFTAMIFGMPFALFPALAEFFGGAKTLGFLYAAPAVGALIVSLFSHWTSKVKRQGAGIAIAAGCWGLAIIFFGFATHLYIALFFLMLAGAADAVSGIFRKTLWNQTIPQDYRGRLAGIEMISYLSGPKLGDAESGLIAAGFGVTVSIVSGGFLCILGVAVCCAFLPKFWRYRC